MDIQGNKIQRVMRYALQFELQNSQIPRLGSTRKMASNRKCETKKEAGAKLS